MSTASGGDDRPMRWSLRLFGGFELCALPGGERVNVPSKRDRVLLAYLLLSPNHRQARRKLTTLLWGEASDETSLDNLRVCVWSLRKALGDTKHRIIASEGDDVVLDGEAFESDVLTLRRPAGQPGTPEAAADLYAGEFLDGLAIESGEFDAWRRVEAQRFRTEAIDALVRLMEQHAGSGEPEAAIKIGDRVLKLDPLHERAIRRLMRLHAEHGRRGAALTLYRTLCDALRANLDAQPEAETRALFAELASGGEDRSSVLPEAPVKRPHPRTSVGRHAWMLAGGVAAAIALFAVYQFAAPSGVATPRPQAAESAAPAPAAISIAVLPFANLSPEPEQEFFSDGITEEITSALARVPNLHVIARTSAFEFKGQNRNIQEIARQLNATHLIEGSVRKAGDQLRITAKLIQADNGMEIWTDTYDRRLVNVFAIQEEIAQAIAAALRVPLGLAAGETLVSNRAIGPEAYQRFLHARSLVQRVGFSGLSEAIKLLEPIVAQHSDFAPAWAQLAMAYQRFPFFFPDMEYATREAKRRVGEEWLTKSEAAAQRSIALDADLPDGYSSLALTMTARGRYVEAEALFSKALALDPFFPEALHSYANMLGAVGRTDDALATRRRLLALDPFVLVYQSGIPDLLWINGQTDSVIANLSVSRSPTDLAYLAKIYSALGRQAEAVDAIRAIPPGVYPEGTVQTAARVLESASSGASSLQGSSRLGRRLNFVYIQAGAPERALERFEDDVAAAYAPPNVMIDLWTPIYASVRKTERFKTYAHDAGLIEYWRAKGWPEFCRPTTGDDFACH